MLTKAILTGSALSVLAFSIVYFGTEGADALERDARETVRVEETALAGAADVAVGEVEAFDPPVETSKPKTKWLDQYLKKSKGKTSPKMTGDGEEAPEEGVDAEEAPEEGIDVQEAPEEGIDVQEAPEEGVDVVIIPQENFDLTNSGDLKKHTGRDEAKGTYVVSKGSRFETLDIDEDIDIRILKDELGLDSDKNIEVRVIRKMGDGKALSGLKSKKMQRPTDYAPILAEAKKLLVIDMRNQAYLEIVDHAVDQGDMGQAADIVEELSTPELRDTARARIGTGLARRGNTEAAFAVLDELEIDELSAPIRLEIITALMATKQERNSFASQR